jgi:hypothetical protein
MIVAGPWAWAWAGRLAPPKLSLCRKIRQKMTNKFSFGTT